MKINLTKILVAGVVILLLYSLYMTNRNLFLGNERDRWKGNFYSGVDSAYANVKDFVLKDLKKYLDLRQDDLLDSLSKITGININPNNVTEVNNMTYHYHDTTIVEIPLQEKEPEIFPFYYADKKECMKLTGFFDLNDTTMNITDREMNTKTTCVKFEKRDQIKWLFGLRIGKKHEYLECLDNCSGVTTVEEIKVN